MSDKIDVEIHAANFSAHFLNFTKNIGLTEEHFECPVLPDTWLDVLAGSEETRKLTPEAWSHGLLSVFLVSICAVFGCFLVPLLEKYDTIFTYMMLYLISLAVSALSGAALLVLIPEGLGLDSCDQFQEPNLIACFGIITTFFVHQIIKTLTGHDEAGHGHPTGHKIDSSTNSEEYALIDVGTKKKMMKDIEDLESSSKSSMGKTCPNDVCPKKNQNSIIDSFRADCGAADYNPKSPFEHFASSKNSVNIAIRENGNASDGNGNEKTGLVPYDKKQHGLWENLKNLKSVGWLCLVGDGVHNFLDGVLIGATFATDINKGWQVTIAIFAEEFPHELGDFAVLVRSGLTFPQAVAANLFSAATCLLGFFLGMFHEDYFGLSVFSWMGGVFLFIALSSMLPEVEEHIADLKKANNSFVGKIKIVGVALLGLLTGYFIVYRCGQIDFEKLIQTTNAR